MMDYTIYHSSTIENDSFWGRLELRLSVTKVTLDYSIQHHRSEMLAHT